MKNPFTYYCLNLNTYFACLKKRRSSVQKSKKKLDSQNRIAKLIKKYNKKPGKHLKSVFTRFLDRI